MLLSRLVPHFFYNLHHRKFVLAHGYSLFSPVFLSFRRKLIHKFYFIPSSLHSHEVITINCRFVRSPLIVCAISTKCVASYTSGLNWVCTISEDWVELNVIIITQKHMHKNNQQDEISFSTCGKKIKSISRNVGKASFYSYQPQILFPDKSSFFILGGMWWMWPSWILLQFFLWIIGSYYPYSCEMGKSSDLI